MEPQAMCGREMLHAKKWTTNYSLFLYKKIETHIYDEKELQKYIF